MDEHEIYNQSHTLGAIIRIKPDMDCILKKFGEDIATLKGGTYNVVRLLKGRHLLDFVHKRCPIVHIEMTYVVEDNLYEDFFEVALKPIEQQLIIEGLISGQLDYELQRLFFGLDEDE